MFSLFLCFSNISAAQSLVYIVVDAKSSLKVRKVIAEFSSELVNNTGTLGESFLYIHINGLNLPYPEVSRVYNMRNTRQVKEFEASVLELSINDEYLSFWKDNLPEYIDSTNPEVLFSNISKNLIKIKKTKGDFENIYLVQFSNLDFDAPVDTSLKIMGDGWLTSPQTALYDFLNGSQSLPFKSVKVFANIDRPEGMPLFWYDERRKFIQKLYSLIGSEVLAINKLPILPYYGGGVIVYESFKNALKFDHQSYGRLTAKKPKLVQLIDPKDLSVEMVMQ
jgi:hypothetical protein